MKETTANLLILICFAGILFGGCIITYFIIIDRVQSCTSNPLKYEADRISHEENLTYSYITFNLYINKYDVIPIKSIKIDLNKNSLD